MNRRNFVTQLLSHRGKWAIPLVLVCSLVFSFDQTVSWTAPTEWIDGEPLLEQDLDYYTLYCNGSKLVDIDSIIGQRSAVIDFATLGEGDHLCVLTVTDVWGRESGPSNTANFTVGPRIPGAPTEFVIAL